jgi:hypothetical protein
MNIPPVIVELIVFITMFVWLWILLTPPEE